MATLPNKVVIEFSVVDRRRIDRLTKALEAIGKSREVTITHNYQQGIRSAAEVYRDAVSGNYVTKEYAEENPDTTVKETVPEERTII